MLCCFASARNKPKYNTTINLELTDTQPNNDTDKDIKHIEMEEMEEMEEAEEVEEMEKTEEMEEMEEAEEMEKTEEMEKIEEIEIIKKYIEDLKTEMCLLCNNFVKLNELYLIEIEQTHINACERCHNLTENEIMEVFKKKCTKLVEEKKITIKYKQKNYILVKYANEDANCCINRFIRLLGINKNKNYYINLIKNKLIEK